MSPRYISGSRAGVGGRPRGEPTKVLRLPLPVANLARRLADGRFRASEISEFLDIEVRTHAEVPLVGSTAPCGFPSPADDYIDRPLDFNELLIHHPAATFAVRVSGESMTGAGIFPGDIAIVDRSLTPVNNCIVLALIGNEFTIKRYRLRGGTVVLQPDNPAYAEIVVNPDSGFEIWGVVKHAIRMF